jgi:hypothetical protein
MTIDGNRMPDHANTTMKEYFLSMTGKVSGTGTPLPFFPEPLEPYRITIGREGKRESQDRCALWRDFRNRGRMNGRITLKIRGGLICTYIDKAKLLRR